MYRVAYYGRAPESPDRLKRKLADSFDIDFKTLESSLVSGVGDFSVFDINLNDPHNLPELKKQLTVRPKGAKVIFMVDPASLLQETRAFAIGATDVVYRPLDARELLNKLQREIQAPAGEADMLPADPRPDVTRASDTLRNIFSAACSGAPPDQAEVHAASESVVGQVEERGLAAWIETVRAHHSQTYQHCLLVTGLAVAFGQRLGVSRSDRQRLSFAGMLHDVGKARIPLGILEKPGPLNDAELAVMKRHPQYGLDALCTVPDLPSEMLDMVVHHHEYLDGSGYPHGLSGSEIPDLVRMITISDVFGALIERRSYKLPMPGEKAYRVLLDMGCKLDSDLVRAFEPVAQLGQ